MKYYKKADAVNAFQMTEYYYSTAPYNEWPQWLQDARKAGVLYWDNGVQLMITTPYCSTEVMVDYWIVQEGDHIYPVKPEIFAKTYEQIYSVKEIW